MTRKKREAAGGESGRFAYDGLERVLHEKARLGIMTSLVTRPEGLLFSELKRLCALTDGNLSRHLDVLREAGLDPETMKATVFYEGRGCLECDGTGFHGRMAIAELLDLSDRIRGLILERRPAAEIKKAAKEEGMIFLRDAALAKVFEGTTTLKEINKVTFVD